MLIEESVSTITSTLLRRVKARDDVAWTKLSDLYSPLVYRWCRAKGLSPDNAADVGQEVFLAVARGIVEYKDGNFRGWLRRITQRKIVDHLRKENKHPDATGGTDAQILVQSIQGDHPEDEEDLAEETKLLYRRVLEWIRGEVSDSAWEAFRRVVVEEKQAGEVAKELGMTRNQVYLAKSRILSRLRQEFDNLGGRAEG